MAQLPRSYVCDKEECGFKVTEEKLGAGIKNWGSVQGFTKDGQEVMLCPGCVEGFQKWMDIPKIKDLDIGLVPVEKGAEA